MKLPVEDIRSLVLAERGIDLSGIEPSVEGEFLVFDLSSREVDSRVRAGTPYERRSGRTRRRVRRRNRIKTRGWNVVAKIKNSQGLVANVYEPFVAAIRGTNLRRAEQRKIVRELLVRNHNRPSEESVDYYLDNTLEYISSTAGAAK